MKLRYWIVSCTAATFLVAGISSAKEEGIKEDARKAGRAVGSATREVVQGAKKTGKEIGHEATKTGKEVAREATKVGKAVGGAAKEGAREVKRAFKGEK